MLKSGISVLKSNQLDVCRKQAWFLSASVTFEFLYSFVLHYVIIELKSSVPEIFQWLIASLERRDRMKRKPNIDRGELILCQRSNRAEFSYLNMARAQYFEPQHDPNSTFVCTIDLSAFKTRESSDLPTYDSTCCVIYLRGLTWEKTNTTRRNICEFGHKNRIFSLILDIRPDSSRKFLPASSTTRTRTRKNRRLCILHRGSWLSIGMIICEIRKTVNFPGMSQASPVRTCWSSQFTVLMHLVLEWAFPDEFPARRWNSPRIGFQDSSLFPTLIACFFKTTYRSLD